MQSDAVLPTVISFVNESNTVDRNIRNLRAKPQDDRRMRRCIATVPGRGYRFIPVFSDPQPAS